MAAISPRAVQASTCNTSTAVNNTCVVCNPTNITHTCPACAQGVARGTVTCTTTGGFGYGVCSAPCNCCARNMLTVSCNRPDFGNCTPTCPAINCGVTAVSCACPNAFCTQGVVRGTITCTTTGGIGYGVCSAPCNCCNRNTLTVSCNRLGAAQCTPTCPAISCGPVLLTGSSSCTVLNANRYNCNTGTMREGQCLAGETTACHDTSGESERGVFHKVCTR